MDEDIKQFWISLRASLLMEAKSLQEQRAAKLAQASDIKKMLDSSTSPQNNEKVYNVIKSTV